VPDDGAIHILKVGPGILERHSHPMLRHADQRETLNRRHEGRHTSVEGVIAHHQTVLETGGDRGHHLGRHPGNGDGPSTPHPGGAIGVSM